ITLLFSWLLPTTAMAATIDLFEEHLLNTQSQLPVSAIHSAYRDREGYLWYGTVNGLCRDDGYHLQVFRPDFLQAQDRVVGSMAEDNDMHLWLGADNGLFWLDKRDNSISPLYPEHWDGERISNILHAPDNCFWLLGRKRISLVDSTGCPLHHYYRTQPGDKNLDIWSMAVVNDKVFASFGDNSLAQLDEANDKWLLIETPEPNDAITRICPAQAPNSLWLLYSQGSIYLMTTGEGKPHFDHYVCSEPMEPFAYSIVQNLYDSTLWVMNTFGVKGYLPNEKKELTKVYSSLESTPKYHMLANIICDSTFSFVSAFDRPSYMLRRKESGMQINNLDFLANRVQFASSVMALAEDSEQWMWMFQERTGLCLIQPETQKAVLWSDCPDAKKYGLDRGRIITHAKEGVWVNHDERMVVYNVLREKDKMRVKGTIDLSTTAQMGEIVSALFEDNQHRLWIGSNLGLYIFNTETGLNVASFPSLGYVSDIKTEPQGNVWITTLEGKLVNFANPENPQIELETEPLSALCFTKQGEAWIGSQAGKIFRYDPRKQQLSDESNACGMNGDRINQLVSDNFNHLWIETNQRIVEYNPANKASHTFSTNDEVISLRRFLPTAVMTSRDGRISFGGIPGMISFTPNNSLDEEGKDVETFITDVQVMKQSLPLGNESELNSRTITLQSSDRDLEIFFSSLDHYNVRQVRYAYRMAGLEKDWKYTVGGENSAYYNQLPKGNYTFEVKATDGNGLWSDLTAQVKIRRLPAFYESTTAYVCYMIAFLLLIAGLIKWTQHKDTQKNELMWNDSEEMLKMRNYLRDETPANARDMEKLPESEYKQLDQAFVANVESKIEEHLSESDFGVEELAMAVNVSKSTLRRKLKSITGQSPLDYIRQKKMHQACLLLQDKDRNITEIAIALGYSDRKYFASCFKKEFGQSPTDFRKEKFGIKSDE
ncbi:MAG: helix-turn-helix domain-containing protein, partial [Bacteroidales bacterium]|nr:helix-turn-helix domain-containing protein [Bacteroidales bacterium]